MTKKTCHTVAYDNVFAVIAVPDAEKHLLRAQLIDRIGALMKERRLRQVDVAKLWGVTQSDVSQMLHGQFRQFSLERLMRFLVALGQDVQIVITARQDDAHGGAQLRVTNGR